MKTIKVQMRSLLIAMMFIAASTPFSNGVEAQETERGFILSMTEFTIKPGHNNILTVVAGLFIAGAWYLNY